LYLEKIMANNNIEIEIQVNVESPKPLIEFLEKNGNFQSEKHQVKDIIEIIK